MTTSRQDHRSRGDSRPVLLLLLTLAALAVRSLWVNWQPLWWDEGYSIYFASEPLARMVQLTAQDIHPPLYYAILHFWAQAAGSLSPATARSLSILIGALSILLIWWLARVFFPGHERVAWIAGFLALINPFHLFYSQEVRMYGLALALGVLSTGWFWLSVRRQRQDERAVGLLICYAVASALALYTLYYAALLLLAQALWAIWALRRRWAILRRLLLAWAAVGFAFLPWLLYAAPKLAGYVAQKVESDQDQPLGLAQYLWQHLTAFTMGHVAPGSQALAAVGLAGVLGIALLAIIAIRKLLMGKRSGHTAQVIERGDDPTLALWFLLLIPTAGAFMLNLRLPFFPTGGERLLLIIWPYLLLLIAFGVATFGISGLVALALLTVSSISGAATFYTTPRYTAHDYRPLIRQVVQQGAEGDTLLAIFPWLVGYWRAYAPPEFDGPQPLLLGDSAVAYGPAVEAVIDMALGRGRVWFPEPLSFGSALPSEIEAHLAGAAANLENRWYSDATRLTAWARAPASVVHPIGADFGPARLVGGGVSESTIASANETLAAHLVWETGALPDALSVTLRLVDDLGRAVWASRDYAPLGSLGVRSGNVMTETVALNIPVGLAPGLYSLRVGVSEKGAPLTAQMGDQNDLLFAPLGQVEIVQPRQPQSPERLPMAVRLAQPPLLDGVAWLGATLPDEPTLAGGEFSLTIFFQSQMASPPGHSLYVSLLDQDGEGAAGWEGWPLPGYPTAVWPDGALVQTPVRFFLPPTLTSGRYQVAAGWLDEDSGAKRAPVSLGEVEIVQRRPQFEPQQPETPLDPPPLLGSHAALTGYSLEEASQAITLTLFWDVQQPILPPHHIFVHADDATGATLAQTDGPPITAAGAAPTGSWLPGEHLATIHRLDRPQADYVLRVGLYEPQTGARLPVVAAGASQGDAVILTPAR